MRKWRTIPSVGNLDPESIHAAQEYALAVVAKPILGRAGGVLVDVAAMLATASAINATLFGAARLASEIATDQLAPAIFSFHSHTDIPVVGVLSIAFLAALLTLFGGLEVIAAFSSMTFLLVSIGVCVANIRLRARTSSSLVPVLAGLVLMGATVALLVAYLWRNNPSVLAFTAAVYAVTAGAHPVFERVRRRRTLSASGAGA